MFKLDALNSFIAGAIGLFFILAISYSLKFMKGRKHLVLYYFYIVLSALASLGVVLTNNLVVLLVCWGFLGLLLYLLINMGDSDAPQAAKKSLVIVGGTDALMIFGIGIIYYFTQTMQLDKIRLELNQEPLILAYFCIASACFAKAGAMPYHSWVPDCAKSAPIPVTAFLPSALDKLLGIYLLSRLSLNLFVMSKAVAMVLMIIGAITIIAAVMMALVQQNLKKLLGYSTVSQVGYMVLGIGTGNPIGIAGGLFHMLNHTVYKSCLFFSAGNVEYRTKTAELDQLGGLSSLMPFTFFSFLVASLSISGIPPFNGFVSKWLIYQGLIQNLQFADYSMKIISIFCLIAAMFGSALTLATFMKTLHAVFLGQRLNTLKSKEIKEVSFTMLAPCLVLAVICIIFGIFAFVLPLKYFIFPVLSVYAQLNAASLPGHWSPVLATILILIGLLTGALLFRSGKVKSNIREDSTFSGGELEEQGQEAMVTGTDFYNTVQEMPFLKKVYQKAQAGTFDLYEQSRKIFKISKVLQFLHNGVLPTYLVWILLGMMGLFLILIG
ncbi:MAG: proton-conducting transporter membrane subunit [Candidatus Omnitrophica bacterium]|nr:proton-conducting transporter membrane subunit [Candidatus Omnitrophota bacterium]MDD5653144.1 proton-conducting transporter membrane subunit [Candidatus Omnitrophota bacterium]